MSTFHGLSFKAVDLKHAGLRGRSISWIAINFLGGPPEASQVAAEGSGL